jgi:hypothetical protein
MNYREALNHLTDEQWFYAVSVAREGWFPSIGDLRELGLTAPKPATSHLSLPAGETGWTDESQATAVKGLALIEAELAKRGVKVGRAVRDMEPAAK